MDWLERTKAEIELAKNARAEGNEGKARVCARRAAGLIAGEYLRRQGLEQIHPSAYVRLQTLLSLPGLSPQVELTCEHFLARVSTDHNLPFQADLIAEAVWLAKALLKIELNSETGE